MYCCGSRQKGTTWRITQAVVKDAVLFVLVGSFHCFSQSFFSCLSAVSGGKSLLCFGGRVEGRGRHYGNDLWIRDCSEGCFWSEVPRGENWPVARHNAAMIVLDEHRVLLHGGATHGEAKAAGEFHQVYLGDVWTFDIRSMQWEEQKIAGPQRHCHALSVVDDVHAVMFGGFGGDYVNDVWLLNLKTFEWTDVTPKMVSPHPRSQMSSCVCSGALWIFGGYFWERSKGEVYFDDLWSLCLKTFVWKSHGGGVVSARNRAGQKKLVGKSKKSE